MKTKFHALMLNTKSGKSAKKGSGESLLWSIHGPNIHVTRNGLFVKREKRGATSKALKALGKHAIPDGEEASHTAWVAGDKVFESGVHIFTVLSYRSQAARGLGQRIGVVDADVEFTQETGGEFVVFEHFSGTAYKGSAAYKRSEQHALLTQWDPSAPVLKKQLDGVEVSVRCDMDRRRLAVSLDGGAFVDVGVTIPARVRPAAWLFGAPGDTLKIIAWKQEPAGTVNTSDEYEMNADTRWTAIKERNHESSPQSIATRERTRRGSAWSKQRGIGWALAWHRRKRDSPYLGADDIEEKGGVEAQVAKLTAQVAGLTAELASLREQLAAAGVLQPAVEIDKPMPAKQMSGRL